MTRKSTSMDIKVEQERDGDALVLLPIKRIDGSNARAFESLVMELINNGERQMVIDCGRLEFISSSGLRVLLVAAKTLKASKRTLAVCAMSDRIEDIFRISGMDRIIRTEASRAAAVAAACAPLESGGPARSS